MWGNMNVVEEAKGEDEGPELRKGSLCLAVEERGSVKLALDGGGIGGSEIIERRVSAATIPPMECPTRITRTDGSIVGEGVPAATSRSIILF